MDNHDTTGPEDGPKPADTDEREVRIGFELRGWRKGRLPRLMLKPGLLLALGLTVPELQQWVQHLHR